MTVKVKIKLREVGVKGLNWDDPVVSKKKCLLEAEFLEDHGRLKEIEFARCLFPVTDGIAHICRCVGRGSVQRPVIPI